MKILVIEDHAVDLKFANRVLSTASHDVSAVEAARWDTYLLKPINTRELSGQLTAVAEVGDAVNWHANERPP